MVKNPLKPTENLLRINFRTSFLLVLRDFDHFWGVVWCRHRPYPLYRVIWDQKSDGPETKIVYHKIYAAIFAEIFSTHFWTCCPGTFFFFFIAYIGLQLDLGSETGKTPRSLKCPKKGYFCVHLNQPKHLSGRKIGPFPVIFHEQMPRRVCRKI